MRMLIGKFDWRQIGGDMNPGAYGATIARGDGRALELRQIQPTREYVGDAEAAELGFPFWSKDGYYYIEDLDPRLPEMQSAMSFVGLTMDDLRGMKPTQRTLALAEAALDYGHRTDEGPSGWAEDVVPGRVQWWGSRRSAGWRFLADEDVEFRRMMREERR